MASVPNTTTFTLQDVINVVGGTSLGAAFTNSVDAYFDSTYNGSKNNLLNFRNYIEVYINCSPTSCRFHYNKVAIDNPTTTVSYTTTYSYAWTTGSHFTYSKSGDSFTITCNANNTSGGSWSDTLTFTQGTLTATFGVTQFTSPN